MSAAGGDHDEDDGQPLWTMLSMWPITADPRVQLTATAFSVTHELLWFGDSSGRLTSHRVPELTLNSATYIDDSLSTLQIDSSPWNKVFVELQCKFHYVCCLFNSISSMICDNIGGVTTLSGSSVNYHTTGCLRKQTALIPEGTGIPTCLLDHSLSGLPELMIGTDAGRLLTYRFQSDTVLPLGENLSAGINCMNRAESGQICLGLSSGVIEFRDLRTIGRQHSILGFSSSVTSLVSHGDVLVASGYTRKGFFNHVPDPLVKVFDLRTYRELPPLIVPPGVMNLSLLRSPIGDLLIALSGHYGEFITFSFESLDNDYGTATQTDSSTSAVTLSCGIANGIALGNADGTGSIWSLTCLSDRDSFQTSAFGEFVELEPCPGYDLDVSIDFENGPLSALGFPPDCDDALLSICPTMLFPSILMFDVFPIDIDEIPGITVVDDGLIVAPFPPNFKRNHVGSLRQFSTAQKATRKNSTTSLSLSPVFGAELPDKTSLIDKGYARAVLKSGRFGTDEFDYSAGNGTMFCGLDNLYPNSFCNAALQALFFIVPFRILMMQHSCQREICLMCELGFLFFMMENKLARPVEPRNFLRALQLVPEADALRLLDTADPSTEASLSVRIQLFISFLLEYLSKEIEQDAKTSSSIFSGMFSGQIAHTAECLGLRSHSNCRISNVYQLKMQYPDEGYPASFEKLIGNTLASYTNMRVWCTICNMYCPTKLSKQLVGLPGVMIFAANIKQKKDLDVWRPTDFSLNDNNVDGKPWVSSWVSPSIEINISDGFTPVVTAVSPVGSVEFSSDKIAIYDLVTVISQINSISNTPDKDSVMNAHNDEHLVAHIRIMEENVPRFFCFNDFVVTPSSIEDALEFRYIWKQPCSLIYCRRGFQDLFPSEGSASVDPTIGTVFSPLHRFANGSFVQPGVLPLQSDEHLGQSSLVAIDSEFVCVEREEIEIHEDGLKFVTKPKRLSLARVSVLRGEGDNMGIAFIDNYITAVETIVDYLTEFSGVHPGDLDPSVSDKHLTTLKASYMCLRSMVDRGVVFVGHGLKKDFQIINLYVPPDQIRDTVELFWINGKRLLSLRFLAQHVLGVEIQKGHHDSIEDARTALLLYRRFVQLQEGCKIDETLHQLYEIGQRMGFK